MSENQRFSDIFRAYRILQDFKSVSNHFGALCIKCSEYFDRLKLKSQPQKKKECAFCATKSLYLKSL